MPAIAIMGGLSAAGGLSEYFGAGNAANAQERAAQQGINTVQGGEQNALNAFGSAQSAIGRELAPFLGLAGGAAGMLGGGTGGFGGMFGAPTTNTTGALAPTGLNQMWGTPFQAPTAADARGTPGYQFMQEAGQQAIQNSAAAQGNLLSGSTLKGLQNYQTGLADTYYQQAYNNALGQYMNKYNIFEGNQANMFNRLGNLLGFGLSGTGMGVNSQMGLAGMRGNTFMGGANSIANLLGQKGLAQASGSMGQGNALGQMFGNLGGLGMLSYLNPGQGGGPSGYDLYTPGQGWASNTGG